MTTGTNSSPESTELSKAFVSLSEKVSVVGWKEALSEEVPWIRRIFKISLLIMSICCFYYIRLSMSYYLQHSGYKDEITDFPSESSLPFSNVTICAQLYFNMSFVRDQLNIPKAIVESFVRQSNQTEDEFYRLLAIYLTPVIRLRERNQILENHLRKIIRSNSVLYDYSNFTTNAYPSCEKILKRCWINGREFDCCRRAVQSLKDDGVCYLIALNMDNDNAWPSKDTVHLNRSGPSGGLTIEAETPLADFPMFDSDADNGYSVFVDATPYTELLTPAVAPASAETFVKVTPSKRILARDCAARGNLVQGIEHDPEGYIGTILSITALTRKHMGCDFMQHMDRPNASRVCDPYLMLVLAMVISMGTDDIRKYTGEVASVQDQSVDATAPKGASASGIGSLGHMSHTMSTTISSAESSLKSMTHMNMLIPKHCVRWTYETSPSFFDLETDHPRKDIMYSRIRIYYGDLAYRQYEQVPEFTVYLEFCELSNLMSLYWGTSVISFVHIVYYLSQYWWVWRKWKRKTGGQSGNDATRQQVTKTQQQSGHQSTDRRIRIRNIKVAPIVSISDEQLTPKSNSGSLVVKYAANRGARVSVVSLDMRM